MKEQFADPRAHLMPGFRRVHGVTAAAAALIFAVLLPALLTWLGGESSVGFVAVVTCLFSAILWSVLTMSTLLMWLFLAVWFSLLSETANDGFKQLVSGRFEAQAIGLLGLGVATTLLGVIRLVRLNEDMREYHLRIPMRWPGRSQMTSPQQAGAGLLPRGLRDWFLDQRMATLTEHVRRASTSWWSRVCRWQVGMPSGWPMWLFGLGAFLFSLLMTWRFGGTAPVHAIAVIGSIFPMSALWGALLRRQTSTQYEFLLPVDRKAHLRQVGMAAAISQMQLWVALSVGAILPWALGGVREPFPPRLADALTFSALSQIWLFGVSVWFLRYRSRVLAFTGFLLAMYSCMIPAMMMLQARPTGDWLRGDAMLWGAAIAAVLGVLLTYGAYRRWLVADLD